MIEITFLDEGKKGFTINGHANYDEHGRDIVCAGVSILAQILASEMKRYSDTVTWTRGGYMKVEVITILKSYEFEAVRLALYRGLHEMARQYAEYVKIIPNRENNT